MSLDVVPAAKLTSAQLVALFNAAYSDYYVPLHLDDAAFETMARLCDLDLARSCVGLEGERPVAVAMLGLRGDRSWIGGMGVVPDARGKGYGALMMRAAIENARACGARSVDLEVLEQNAPAIRIYQALGFRETRRLDVWARDAEDTPAPALPVAPADLGAALEAIGRWRTGPPPWQRERATLAHVWDSLEAFACSDTTGWVGALMCRVAGGRLSLVDLTARELNREGILEALVCASLASHAGLEMRLLNLPADDPAAPVLARLGARVKARQIDRRGRSRCSSRSRGPFCPRHAPC